MIRTILLPLTAEMPSEALFDAALVLARKVNAHIRALFMLPDPDTALANISDVILAAGLTRKAIERETQEAAPQQNRHFVAWRSRNNIAEQAGGGLDTCVATWAEQTGEIEILVTCYGRLSDLILVPKR